MHPTLTCTGNLWDSPQHWGNEDASGLDFCKWGFMKRLKILICNQLYTLPEYLLWQSIFSLCYIPKMKASWNKGWFVRLLKDHSFAWPGVDFKDSKDISLQHCNFLMYLTQTDSLHFTRDDLLTCVNQITEFISCITVFWGQILNSFLIIFVTGCNWFVVWSESIE